MSNENAPENKILRKGADRNLGIDLLRIVSMLMVVVLHVNGFPKFIYTLPKNSLNYLLFWFTEAFCICAVNVYAMISGYVLLKSKFKLKRILQLYIEVFFFNILSYVLMALTQEKFYGFKDFIKGFVFITPLTTEYIWYLKAYLLLYMVFPLLNLLINNMSKKQFILLFAVIAVFLCFLSFYGGAEWHIGGGYSFIWLVVMYFIGAYFRKFGLLKASAVKCFALYCISSAAIFAILIINNFIPHLQIDTVEKTLNLKYNSYGYTSIFVVLQAVFLFNVFAKLKIKSGFIQKSIHVVSPLTFGIYIMHCTEYGKLVFIKYTSFIGNCPSWSIIPISLGCAVAIFTVCAIIEWVKQTAFKYLKIDKLTFAAGDYIQNKISSFAEKKASE